MPKKKMNNNLLQAVFRVFAFYVLCIGASQTEAQDRVALLIGNNDYPEDGNFHSLKNCVNDVELLEKTLKTVGFNVTVVKNASQSKMDDALLTFEKAIPEGGTALIYFAGHGIEWQGGNYLMASNAKLKARSRLSEEALKADTFAAAMVQAGAKTSFLLLDCCRETPANADWATRGQRKYGLAEISIEGDIVIGLAASPGKPALEPDEGGGNSPYALALSKWIPTGLKHTDFFDKVRREVHNLTNGQQRTWENGSFLDPFYFAKKSDIDPPQVTISGPEYFPWSKEAVESFSKLKMKYQDGKIQTTATSSRLILINYNGRPGLEVPLGNGKSRKTSSTEWLMDALFRPKVAAKIPALYVDGPAAKEAFGISPKNDGMLFSIDELQAVRDAISKYSNEQSARSVESRSYKQEAALRFSRNVSHYEYLLNQFLFARSHNYWSANVTDEIKDIAARNLLPGMLEVLPEANLKTFVEMRPAENDTSDDALFKGACRFFAYAAISGSGFQFIPSKLGETLEWYSVGDLMELAAENRSIREGVINDLSLVKEMVKQSENGGADFVAAIERIVELQQQRDPEA